jgi:hypothetical protein
MSMCFRAAWLSSDMKLSRSARLDGKQGYAAIATLARPMLIDIGVVLPAEGD